MHDIEKLGLFYLGRRYDLETAATLEEPILYDSRDLVTHAVCVGMTGSGKTGLCLALLEEAAIDGVPVIAIDPKGDLGNLLLTFPGLSPEEFRPWIDEDEARRAGMTAEAFAADQARRWQEGLAEWGQDAARIERLRQAAEFAIYTPGSRAGRMVSILTSFKAPPPPARADGELLAERAGSTASSLLALAGVDAPPRSREHSLLATLFLEAWREGQDLDLGAVIQQLQAPPFDKIGVVELEAFFPQKDRFELAMRLNALLAAPGFAQWMEGEPLDPASLLYTPEGHPRVSIFSIAHLGDAERMFFVSLLLNQIVSWMRSQKGTTSLRAILYMDEILGYFPPVANPPSKPPLLTLLKQGRAFGLGTVLATQNPVDLDYKGLANTGTWFLGRMQTERDKDRVLDGLESAAAGGIDRAEAGRLLSALGKRVFLLHNVHATAPVVFHSRWALSYLRGPLSREQIKQLTPPAPVPSPAEAGGGASAEQPQPSVVTAAPATAATAALPILSPEIQQLFPPVPAELAGDLTYLPVLIGAARVGFSDARLRISEERDVLYTVPVRDAAVPVDWTAASRLAVSVAQLTRKPQMPGAFAPLPPAAAQPKSYAAWEKAFGKWLASLEKLELLHQAELKLTARPDESEREFRLRVQDARRAARDQALGAVQKKFGTKQMQLSEQVRRAEAAIAEQTQQASQQKLQTAVSFGATVLNALLGRRAVSAGTIGRATTAARGVGRSMKEADDVKQAEEKAVALRARLSELEEQIGKETAQIAAAFEAEATVERLAIGPKRGQVTVQFVALGWLPQGTA